MATAAQYRKMLNLRGAKLQKYLDSARQFLDYLCDDKRECEAILASCNLCESLRLASCMASEMNEIVHKLDAERRKNR